MKKIIAALLGAFMTIAGVAPASFAMNANFVKKSDFYINDGRETNIRTIFKPTDDTADKQNNIFDEETVKVEGTKSIKFAFENAVAGKTADINHKQGVDISSVKKSGYICFDMYIETEIEDELYPQIIISDNTTNGTGSTPVSLTGLSYNEWNEVSVKLSDFGTSINDFDILKQVSLTLSEAVESKYNVYLQSIAIYEAPVLTVTDATCEEGTLEVSWDYSVSVSEYKIYSGDTLLGTVNGEKNSFSGEYKGIDSVLMITVKAFDGDGKVVGESEAVKCIPSNKYVKKVISFYENQGYSNGIMGVYIDKMDSGYSFSNTYADSSPLGGYAARFALNGVTEEIQLQLNSETMYDVTDIYNNGFVRFYIYIDTELTDYHNIKASFRDKSGKWTETLQVDLPDLEYNKWQTVELDLNQFKSDTFEFDKLYRLELKKFDKVTEKFDIYVQGIGFYKRLSNPTLSVTDSGINKDGKAYAEITCSENLSSAVCVPGYFSINGMNCVSAELDTENSKIVRVVFDGSFEFPKEYEINIDNSFVSADNLEMESYKLKFTTSVAQNVISVNVNTPQTSGRTVTCTASAKPIYSADSSAQDITMLFVVYSGQKIINVDYDSKTDVAMLKNENFECTAEVDDEYDISTIRTEVYFVNNLTEGRPLCESKAF